MKPHKVQEIVSPSGKAFYLLDGVPLKCERRPSFTLSDVTAPRMSIELLVDMPIESLAVSEEYIAEFFGPNEVRGFGRLRRAGHWWRSWF